MMDAAGGSKPYRCGSISTYKAYKYGRFAGRIYNPYKNGTVVSLFTYWMGATADPKDWSEIDIELVPSITHQNGSQGPFHVNLIYEGHQMSGWPIGHGDATTVGWHNYEFEWTPDYI